MIARDALAAERRRQPMMRIEKDYVFDGPYGKVHLVRAPGNPGRISARLAQTEPYQWWRCHDEYGRDRSAH